MPCFLFVVRETIETIFGFDEVGDEWVAPYYLLMFYQSEVAVWFNNDISGLLQCVGSMPACLVFSELFFIIYSNMLF